MINHAIGAAGVVSQECKAVVDQYGQTIIDFLMVEAEPKKICSQVGLCTFDGTRGVSAGIESVVDEKEGRSSGLNDAMCSACEMAVVWMQNQVAQNQTQDRIINNANELCERMPSPLGGESAVDCGKFLLCQILHSLLVGNLLISPQESIMAVLRDIGFNKQIGFHYRTLYSIEIVSDV
ncbi:hypothetical protein ACS0TY_024840 [Phlomoides rotata]